MACRPIAAHVLFNLAVVILIVRSRLAGIDRSLIEASEDLYATPLATFRQVTLPLLMPAIIAGFLLAFTFSFEDFIIAFFVAGPNNTLPIYIFAINPARHNARDQRDRRGRTHRVDDSPNLGAVHPSGRPFRPTSPGPVPK
jgi:ABC-type spermidine/putrescine transport system permease subunit II